MRQSEADVAKFIAEQKAAQAVWVERVKNLMIAHFDRERAIVLAKLSGQKTRRMIERKARDISADDIFPINAFERDARKDADGFLTAMTRQFVGDQANRFGLNLGAFTNPALINGYAAQVNRIVGVEDTTYQQIKAALLNVQTAQQDAAAGDTTQEDEADAEAVFQGGGTLQDFIRAVEDVFGDAKGYRAEMIARTEVAQASSNAALAVGTQIEKQSDGEIELQKTWLATDGLCCDICQTNLEASPIAMDDTFPSGDDAPTAHPNCVCALMTGLVDPLSLEDLGPDLNFDVLGEDPGDDSDTENPN